MQINTLAKPKTKLEHFADHACQQMTASDQEGHIIIAPVFKGRNYCYVEVRDIDVVIAKSDLISVYQLDRQRELIIEAMRKTGRVEYVNDLFEGNADTPLVLPTDAEFAMDLELEGMGFDV